MAVQKVRKTTKASKTLENLRQDIVCGIFSPSEKLQMDQLKERYGVGYSPLREALSRLVSNGLVEVKEQCGFAVTPLSLTELYDLYHVRAQIDWMALELAIKCGDDEWEAEILSSWHRYKKYLQALLDGKVDSSAWGVNQKQFRDSLVSACNSPWLLRIRAMLYDQAERYRMICLRENGKQKQFISGLIKENNKLVDALLSKNYKQAEKLMHDGWNKTIDMIAKHLKQNN